MPKTSIYITDDLMERIDADCEVTQRSRSNWLTVAAENELRARGTPEPPPVVQRYDESVKGRT